MGLLTQLIAQKHQEKMQQALYKSEADRAVLLDPNATQQSRQTAYENLSKAAPQSPQAQGLLQHIGHVIFGGGPKPPLTVPQLTPPPGQQAPAQLPPDQNASFGPTAGGGIPMLAAP